MKKIYKLATSVALICGCTITSTHAQTTGTTELNVVINPLLSITVNDAEVPLEFTTLADYQTDGALAEMTGHLTITSILPYTVSLAANTATLSGTGTNADEINASAVTVTAPASTNNSALPGNDLKTISALSMTAQELITGSYALAAPADVTYSIPQSKVVTEIIGKTPDTYTAVLTYSITNP